MDLVETLHVVGAVFLVGPVAAAGMYAPRYVRAGDPAALGLLRRISLFFGVGTLVVGLLGFGLVTGDTGPGWAGWVIASILLWAVAAALTLGVLVPTLDRAAQLGASQVGAPVGAIGSDGSPETASPQEAVSEPDRTSAAPTAPLVPRALLGGILPAVLYVVVAVLMVVRPGG